MLALAKHNGDKTLYWTLIGVVAFVAAAGTAGFVFIKDIESVRVSAALTNIAQVGGIISGLSLSGTAVLTLNGRFSTKILEHYGPVIRFVLFGGFSILIALSFLASLAVMWETTLFARAVIAYATPAMLIILVFTALLINSAFAWDRSRKKPLRKNPAC